jgi:diguanylate cyclase (GGDEF)-like protein
MVGASLSSLRAFAAAFRAAWRIAPECRSHVEALVRARTAAFARALAVLTLGWVVLDFLALDPARAEIALALRLAMATALWLLAWQADRLPGLAAMWLLVALQATGFGALQWLVPAQGHALLVGYGLFPYLMAAQLALFPLPWGRSLLAALFAASQLGLLLWLEHAPPDTHFWSHCWLFVLIVASGLWTGQSQLLLMERLLAAHRDASHDPLTGLANRRHAETRLAAACADSDRRHEALSVLMLDIDHFKRVNDRYGHAGGDSVLVALAQRLRRELRGNDLAVRHGGEEFLVVLPACDAGAAMATAERIRLAVAAMTVATPDGDVRVTISVGAATRQPDEPPAALVARADAALYRAKAAGRDRSMAA